MATLRGAIEMQNAMARINIENRAKGIEGLYMASYQLRRGAYRFVGSNRHLEYTAIGTLECCFTRRVFHNAWTNPHQ